jgi:hypothetical protein
LIERFTRNEEVTGLTPVGGLLGFLKDGKFYKNYLLVLEMDGFDLTRFQEDEKEQAKIAKIMGKMLSGRSDYRVVIEKRDKKVKKCECGWPVDAGAKFCCECGAKC